MTAPAPGWSIHTRTAFALAIWPIEIVHRQTLRALLPKGDPIPVSAIRRAKGIHKRQPIGSSLGDYVTRQMGQALAELEHAGMIRRGYVFVQVIDPQGLADEAMRDHETIPRDLLRWAWAADEIARQIQRESIARVAAIRRQEIAIIRSLMRSRVSGSHWSGRGSVRFVPAGGAR